MTDDVPPVSGRRTDATFRVAGFLGYAVAAVVALVGALFFLAWCVSLFALNDMASWGEPPDSDTTASHIMGVTISVAGLMASLAAGIWALRGMRRSVTAALDSRALWRSIQAEGIEPDYAVHENIPDELTGKVESLAEASLAGHLKNGDDEQKGSEA